MTAAVGLHQKLRLPEPWQGLTNSTALIIYRASSTVGAFAVKLAALSNIHPIVAVARNRKKYVESLIDRSKGDFIIDYREEEKAIYLGLKTAIRNNSLRLDRLSAMNYGGPHACNIRKQEKIGVFTCMLHVANVLVLQVVDQMQFVMILNKWVFQWWFDVNSAQLGKDEPMHR